MLHVIFGQKCQIITGCSSLEVTLQVFNYLQPEAEVSSKNTMLFFQDFQNTT